MYFDPQAAETAKEKAPDSIINFAVWERHPLCPGSSRAVEILDSKMPPFDKQKAAWRMKEDEGRSCFQSS